MNKATTLGITLLAVSLLTGCGNNSNKKAAVSKRNSSSLIAKKKAESESRAKESSKKASSRKASSESKAKAKTESESKASSESVAASSSSTQSIASATKNSSSTEPEPTTLTEFVNKYGESPAAYKVDHDGMTGKQALAATPDNMETFGELQVEHPAKSAQESSSSSSNSYSPSDDPNSQENKAAHAKGGMLYGAPKNYTTAKWSSEEEAPNIKWRAEHGYSD